jgi:cytochrome c oxidase subunit III
MSAAIPVEAHDGSTSMDNDSKVRLGMLFYVLTDVTFVIFLLVGYVWLRAYNVNGDWYPFKSFAVPDEGTSLVLMLLMVASGVCYFIGYRAIVAGNKMLLSVFATVALILTVVTLVGQIRFTGAQPFAAQDGSFASEWLLLSGYHIYHLIIGTFLGLGLVNRAWRGRYAGEKHLGVTTIGYFWYWMALTPVIVWLMMTLLPPKI